MATEAADDQEIFERVKAPLRSVSALAGMGIRNAARKSSAAATDRRNRDVRRIEEIRGRERAMLESSKANLETVFDSAWIDQASAEEISARYQEAMAWQGRDARIDEAASHIRDVVHERYGAEVSSFDRAALERAINHEAIDHIDEEGAGNQEEKERDAAGNLIDRADHLDALADETEDPQIQHEMDESATETDVEGAVAFDSAERLQNEVKRLASAELDDQQVEDAIRVELSHTQPVNETVRDRESTTKRVQKATSLSNTRNRPRIVEQGR